VECPSTLPWCAWHLQMPGDTGCAAVLPPSRPGAGAGGTNAVAVSGSVSAELWVRYWSGGGWLSGPSWQLLQKVWKTICPSQGKFHPVFPELWMGLILQAQVRDTPSLCRRSCRAGGRAWAGQRGRRASSQGQDADATQKMLYQGKLLHRFILILILT